MTVRVRFAVALGLALLLAGAKDTLAEKKEKPGKDKKAEGASFPVTFTTQQRGAAQGMINICTSVGTLLSAAVVSAVADFSGGGARGFGIAYLGVAASMALMLPATLGLRHDSGTQLKAEPAA